MCAACGGAFGPLFRLLPRFLPRRNSAVFASCVLPLPHCADCGRKDQTLAIQAAQAAIPAIPSCCQLPRFSGTALPNPGTVSVPTRRGFSPGFFTSMSFSGSLISLKELRNILRIGLPIFIAQLSQIGMNFVDTIMAGRYAARDLAGVAIAGSLWAPITLFAVGCLLALPGMSAQLVGARKPERAAHLLRQGFFLSTAMCVVLITVLYHISENLHLLGIDEELAPVTSGYLKAMLFGLPGFLFFINVRSFFEGFGRTRPAMVIGIICLFINIPCNYVFIYGHLGMPEMGGVGCGVATSICYWCMFLSILFFLHRDRALRKYAFFAKDKVQLEGRKLDVALIATVVRVGFPNAIALCLEVSAFALTALLLAPLGTTVVAGHQITINYSSIIFAIPLSIAMTATIRTGQLLGAAKYMHARSAAQTALLLGFVIAIVTMTVTIALREQIVSLYNNDTDVLSLAASLMLLCGIYQVVDTLQNISCGVLRGYNDTRIIFSICLIAYGLLALGGGYILGRTDLVVPAMGAAGFWVGYIIALSFCALCYGLRLRYLHRLAPEKIRAKLAK